MGLYFILHRSALFVAVRFEFLRQVSISSQRTWCLKAACCLWARVPSLRWTLLGQPDQKAQKVDGENFALSEFNEIRHWSGNAPYSLVQSWRVPKYFPGSSVSVHLRHFHGPEKLLTT